MRFFDDFVYDEGGGRGDEDVRSVALSPLANEDKVRSCETCCEPELYPETNPNPGLPVELAEVLTLAAVRVSLYA